MCGIAGLFARSRAAMVDGAAVARMLDPMAHRGPDGRGVWTAPGVGMGHLRLSIIDIAGSPQPMRDDDTGLTISFNGEIYNYKDLRTELQRLGRSFQTDGDTEVLLKAWGMWGAGALDRLHGMFAFAVHDARDGSLTLVRDRLGVKPLHYAALPDGAVAFASEMKGLLAVPQLRRTPDVRAVEDYLALGYVPDDASIVAGISKLPAGSLLTLRHDAPPPAPRRWWTPDFSRRATGSDADIAAELVHHIRTGVRDRMVADVPLGAFLSGGVDSSAVVAMMAEASDRPVRTCSIGFDQASLDETAYARLVAARFGTDHRERVVRADDHALIPTIAALFDEPFADASALPTYRVCELARETVTVALSGDGADEALAGYRRQVFHHHEERVRAAIPAALRRTVLAPLAAMWPRADWAPRPLRAKATLTSLSRTGAEGYADAVGVTGRAMRSALFSDAAHRALGGHVAEARIWAAMADAPAREALDRAQYADLMIWLPGDILTKLDRMSMGVSLEARESLLDHRLVEFAATIPARLRVAGATGKAIMKRALEPHLPRDILYRPKMGFVTPISAWFRGPLAARAEALSRSERLGDTGWFDMDAIATLAQRHARGRSDHGRQLWQFLMLEQALERLFP